MSHFSTKPELAGLRNRKIISGVFEGKSPTDYESAWSPTSPLDFRLLSSFGNPFGPSSSAMPIRKRKQKSWDSEKVGLMSIVDSPDDHPIDSSGVGLPSQESKGFVLMRHGNPKCRKPYLPNLVVDDLPVSFHPFAKVPMHLLGGSRSVNGYGFVAGSITVNNSAGEVMKQSQGSLVGSEDYTRVISHGPNPKTTHFYGNQLLKTLEDGGVKIPFFGNEMKESIFAVDPINVTAPPTDVFPSNDFLSFCWLCKKKLFLGKEIYMYSGYKAFCSSECRAEEIDRDEKMEQEAKEKEKGYEAESDSGSSSGKDLPKKKTNRAFVSMV